jgi:beta-glucosidase
MAYYYSNPDLTSKPFLVQPDTELSAMWISSEDPLSCRWSGAFVSPDTGTYTFGVLTDDFARVYINNELIIDKNTSDTEFMVDDRAADTTGDFDAAAGKSYPIVVEYRVNPERKGILRRFRLGCQPPVPPDLMERAVKAASVADIALVFVGTSDEWESESFDREDMELPGRQAELVERVAAANPNTVVVLSNGSPLAMSGWLDSVSAVVEAWFPGQECGNAIADILFGMVNPSGKLPVTFPFKLEDSPAFTNYPGKSGKVHYAEGIFVGYRHYDKNSLEPLFPFGHGLSYTTFDYGNLVISPRELEKDGRFTVKIDVKNTGAQSGKEVVQLYIHDIESTVTRPPRELKAFDKIHLEPGEKQTVVFNLDIRSLSFYATAQSQWTAEPGKFEVLVGASSRDIRSAGTFILK